MSFPCSEKTADFALNKIKFLIKLWQIGRGWARNKDEKENTTAGLILIYFL